MKVVLATLVSLLMWQCSFGQATVSNEQSHTLYFGIDNPITFMAANNSCNNLKIECSQGKLLPYKGCYYIFHSDSLGPVLFTVRYKENGKNMVMRREFIVRKFPKPLAILGGYQDSVTIEEIIAAQRLKVQIGDLDYTNMAHGAYLPFSGFTIAAFRSDSLLFYQRNPGDSLSESNNVLVSKLQAGDKLIFLDIKAKGHSVTPLEFTISRQPRYRRTHK